MHLQFPSVRGARLPGRNFTGTVITERRNPWLRALSPPIFGRAPRAAALDAAHRVARQLSTCAAIFRRNCCVPEFMQISLLAITRRLDRRRGDAREPAKRTALSRTSWKTRFQPLTERAAVSGARLLDPVPRMWRRKSVDYFSYRWSIWNLVLGYFFRTVGARVNEREDRGRSRIGFRYY